MITQEINMDVQDEQDKKEVLSCPSCISMLKPCFDVNRWFRYPVVFPATTTPAIADSPRPCAPLRRFLPAAVSQERESYPTHVTCPPSRARASCAIDRKS